MSDCQTCLPIANCLSEDLDLYSLQQVFGFVTRCPSGLTCNASELHMDCCGTQLSVVFPLGVSIEQREAITASLVAECARRLTFCDRFIIPPPNGVLPPPTFYFNSPQIGFSNCPDGLTFTYLVQAGMFLALTRDEANESARLFAASQAAAHRICLSNINPFACKDNAIDKRITATGNFLASPPLTNFWQLISGTLPAGVGITGLGSSVRKFITLTGTPTEAGVFNFTVKITAPNGDNMRKPYQLTIAEITTASPLPGFLPNIAYTQNLEVSPAHDQETESWSVISGDLPPGFELTTAGVLHGTTDATNQSFLFEVQVTFKPTGSDNYLQCTKEFTIEAAIPQPISYWQLEEASGVRGDLMLNRNDMTPTGAVGSGTGHLGNAYEQTVASPVHIEKLASTTLIFTPSTGFTVCGWFRLVSAGVFSGVFGWVLKNSGGTPIFDITLQRLTTVDPPPARLYASICDNVGVTCYSIILDATVYYDSFHFFRLWYVQSENKLYLQIDDGTKHSVTVGFTPATPVTADFEVGRTGLGYRVDEIGVWDEVLTDDQVTNLISAGINGMEIPANVVVGFDGSFADITWSTAQTNSGSEFQVIRSGELIATVAAGTNTYHDATVQSGQTYSYVVRFYTS